MSFRFQFRRGTTAERNASNPILAAGEPAVVLDSGQPAELVLGDGATAMADLRAAVWDDDARLAAAATATQPGDLGTAAAADVGDFGTAAQGAKADTAVQPAALVDYAGLGSNIQATVRKLSDDVNDVKVLVLGDSTAAQAGQWPYLLMPQVQALYPHRTLRQRVWNTGTSSYDAATTVTAGTGATFIDFYQGAVSGTVPESIFATMAAQVADVQPDLIMVHHGHNYGKDAAGGGQPNDVTMDYVFRERMTRFVAEVQQLCPQADIMLTSQNPYLTSGARYQISNVRAQAFRGICADFGLAYGPILEAYLDTGNAAAYIGADGLHPFNSGTYNGAALAASAILPFFRGSASAPVSARVASPFMLPGINLLTNGTFSDFAAPPALPGWTASAVTLSKDTTNYESKNGWAVKGVTTGTGGGSMYQILPIRRVRGQVITFAGRFYIPAAQVSSQPGRVQLSSDAGFGSVTSGTLTNVRDRYVWAFVTGRVPTASTYVTASVIFGNGAVGQEASIDRASLVLGNFPRDTTT